jgi:hypothetical protein
MHIRYNSIRLCRILINVLQTRTQLGHPMLFFYRHVLEKNLDNIQVLYAQKKEGQDYRLYWTLMKSDSFLTQETLSI